MAKSGLTPREAELQRVIAYDKVLTSPRGRDLYSLTTIRIAAKYSTAEIKKRLPEHAEFITKTLEG